ncbi:membrane protein [Citricoccus nitrophenolicus]
MADVTGPETSRPLRRNQGLGRILVMVYAVFALSSFARSMYQILVHFDDAPLAYLLSGFAAAVYIVATLSLARSGRTAWFVSLVAVGIELLGVVGIGLWTVLDPQLFAEDTVWSRFGSGYGYIPLVLPIIGMAWLLAHRPRSATAETPVQPHP